MKSYKIHPLYDVQTEQIGVETTVWQFSVILKHAQIGSNYNINALILLENDVVIGNNVTVEFGVQIWEGLRIADNVFIGPNVTFTNGFTPRSKKRPIAFLKTVIEHHASIGANATVVGGTKIGAYALDGAGSVVTKDIPDYVLVYGNPTKQHGWVCQCGTKLQKFNCPSCYRSYVTTNNLLTEQNRTAINDETFYVYPLWSAA